MDHDENRIEAAARLTEVLRHPRQHLNTFGITNIYYYLVTEPSYGELSGDAVTETVVREGRVVAERPKIVTPYYLSHLEGFSGDARNYFDHLLKLYGPQSPGLFYSYRNEPKNLNIVSDAWPSVVDKLNAQIDKKDDPLSAIVKGEDTLWDVSLLKFIYETTARSVPGNVAQLKERGLLGRGLGGVPEGVRRQVDEMFQQVKDGDLRLWELERELNRWGLFEEYEDRFFVLVQGLK